MKPLIRNQKIRIDSHQRGDGRLLDIASVHIHKSTKQPIPIDGKKQHVVIEIPLHGDHEPLIQSTTGRLDDIPRQLKEEIQEALSNKKQVAIFVKEVLHTLQNYPGWHPEDLIDALRRIASIIGIEWTEEQLQTYSNNALGFVCHLQLFDHRDKTWYGLAICNQGLQIEDIMDERPFDYNRPRFVIADRGRSNMGKSSVIKTVWEILSSRYPHEIIKHDYDIKGIIKKEKCLVGIESQGDPNSRMQESMDDFVQYGCDIILTACRTRGETYEKLFDLYYWYNYEIILLSNPHPYYYQHSLSEEMLRIMNIEQAEGVVRIIENLI